MDDTWKIVAGPAACKGGKEDGEALAPLRNQVVIATKFGFDLDPNTEPKEMKGLPGLNSRPEHIKATVERMPFDSESPRMQDSEF